MPRRIVHFQLTKEPFDTRNLFDISISRKAYCGIELPENAFHLLDESSGEPPSYYHKYLEPNETLCKHCAILLVVFNG